MAHSELQSLVDDATFEFTLGNHEGAEEKLKQATSQDPGFFAAWHALAEVYLDQRKLEEALEAAEQAQKINDEDVHLCTTLSRIWMEKGDKETAEQFGAQARLLGWKNELKGEND